MEVELVPVETLLPHEKVVEHRVDNLETVSYTHLTLPTKA